MIGGIFWIWYSIGAVLLLGPGVPAVLGFANGFFLMLFGLYALVLIKKGLLKTSLSGRSVSSHGLWRLWASAACIWTGGMALEWVGVHSGRLFGTYQYSDILGPHWFGVPVTLGFAWIGVVGTAVLLSRDFGQSGFRLAAVRSVQTGVWAVLLDLVLDPVAYARGFWNWKQDSGGMSFYGVPASNFLGWFIVSILLSFCLPHIPAGKTAVHSGTRLYQGMLVFFGLLALKEGLWGAVCIALLGTLAAEGSWRYARSRQVADIR
ncbi:carotenoid biosynthesis protein [Paenibacillus sp. CN-4]|uniref:carotenoid biosynthesis protein n=1 Tax=Paenibacillus nanchangensis TaxID=3348343 RepID=UPI00397C5581